MGSKRTGVMLAYPMDEKRLAKMPEFVLIQRKFNGERVKVLWRDDKPILISSCGNEMPFFKSLKEEITETIPHGLQLDGELYYHGMEREEIHSIASRRTNPHPDEGLLGMQVFDLINGQEQYGRILYSRDVVPTGERITLVKTELVRKDYILDLAHIYIQEGYEGVIIRDPGALYTPRKCNFMLKFKPTSEDIYTIVGWEEEEDIYGNPKDTLGSLLVKDDDGLIFSVGTGKALTKESRKELWKNPNSIIGQLARVKHSDIKTVNGFPTCTSLVSIDIF